MRKRVSRSILFWRDGGVPTKLAFYAGVDVKAALGYAIVSGEEDGSLDYSSLTSEAHILFWFSIRRDNNWL